MFIGGVGSHLIGCIKILKLFKIRWALIFFWKMSAKMSIFILSDFKMQAFLLNN